MVVLQLVRVIPWMISLAVGTEFVFFNFFYFFISLFFLLNEIFGRANKIKGAKY